MEEVKVGIFAPEEKKEEEPKKKAEPKKTKK